MASSSDSPTPKLEPGALDFVHADDAASTLRLHLAGLGLSVPLAGSAASSGGGIP